MVQPFSILSLVVRYPINAPLLRVGGAVVECAFVVGYQSSAVIAVFVPDACVAVFA